jgi:hypothetical protein
VVRPFFEASTDIARRSDTATAGYALAMDEVAIGKSGLKGWRAKVADVVAPPIAKRSPLREDQIRALIGMSFLVLSIVYVVGAIRDIVAHD